MMHGRQARGWTWGEISGGRRWEGSSDGRARQCREGVDQVVAQGHGSEWGQGDGEEGEIRKEARQEETGLSLEATGSGVRCSGRSVKPANMG